MGERKVVQTELDSVLYAFVLKTAESKGLTLKEASRRALEEWAAREGNLSWDRLFDPNWGFKTGKMTDASKVDETLYRRRKR